MEPVYQYKALVERVVDGDTLDLQIDLGFHVHLKVRVRLFGVDTPEVYGVRKETEEYQRGAAASAFTAQWVAEHGSAVIVRSYDATSFRTDKYGRWLVEVFPLKGGESLNDALVASGNAEFVLY